MNDNGTLQLPPQASDYAQGVDSLYYFIFWGCMVFFVIIVALSAFFILKYRRREGDTYRPSPTHNTPLEIAWSVIPMGLLLVVFFWGFEGYLDAHIAPAGATEYYVTGKQWLWEIRGPEGGATVNDMYVEVNKPVKVILTSTDVIHSFFVPAFRVKMDAYPNQYTTLWFEPNRTGDFDIFCTEYCGDEHSGMIGKVHVLSASDYETYLKEASGPGDKTPEEWGAELYTKNACVTCHSADGAAGAGPTFKGIWGTQEPLADGTTVLVDENYIRESILEPGAKVVSGFQPVMPTYTGILDDEQISALIAYIKSLGE